MCHGLCAVEDEPMANPVQPSQLVAEVSSVRWQVLEVVEAWVRVAGRARARARDGWDGWELSDAVDQVWREVETHIVDFAEDVDG